MSEPEKTPPKFDFSFTDSLLSYNVPAKDWLAQHDKEHRLDGLATANVVLSDDGQRVLLIQRAAHDSFPGRWEAAGGAVDAGDPTILHAGARELWEEAGLVAKRFTHVISERSGLDPGYAFSNRNKTKTWCRLSFAVEVMNCNNVKLDPNEHQDFLWATEEEVRDRKVGERQVQITTENMAAIILEAFRLKKEQPRT